ncbi:MAG TPA: enolase C-terminal domain-like protein [Thermoanaerobaculia bacterium]|nr:enolase C-terminal domain-like protein [Thermoanaerobaculia bacterium]
MNIEAIDVAAYTIPTATPESDGTLEWSSTTLVAVHASAGGKRGFGYTYADVATAAFIRAHFVELIVGRDAMSIESAWAAMIRAVRNLGRRGVAAMAISAVDAALWDLKCKLLGLPLVTLLGQVREAAPVYMSGGFTSYTIEELKEQLVGWPRVKMKVGRDARADRERVRAVREAIGGEAELFVDANGAWTRQQALEQGRAFAEENVSWFEEPVSSDDLDGLRFLRDNLPMDVAAGEYGYELLYFENMINNVDVLQADATRCLGITGFIKTSALCEARGTPLSAHCAPSLHAHPACALLPLRHIEYFFDHVRIESRYFDGFTEAKGGTMVPDLSRPGIGVELKEEDLLSFRA